MKKIYFLALAWLCLPMLALTQGFNDYNGGLKVPLDESGEKYFRLLTWHQVWLRYNDNNSGSTRLEQSQSATSDVGLRRSRFLMYAQLNERFLILTHFGINNQNAISGGYLGLDGKKPQLYMHDAWVEYTVFKRHLSIGTGLHYWNGLSRMTSASTLNFMTMDAPILNWATIEAIDQFARKLGVYAKGKVGKLAYQVSLNDPFKTNNNQDILDNRALYSPFNVGKVSAGYFQYEFAEEESQKLPYRVGSYLGTKKVFNLGAGFLHNADAMWSRDAASGDTLSHDLLLLAVDAFVDWPLAEGRAGAITACLTYYWNDFGPNNFRNIGLLNPADGSTLANSSLRGNAFPTVGTGQSFYGQVGYMLPKKRPDLVWQPYASLIYSRLEGLSNAAGDLVPVSVLDLGLNCYLAGHHSKLTLNYRHRPDFNDIEAIRYRPELTLQAMVYL